MLGLEIKWVRQGAPAWEQWWVDKRGHTRSHEPTRAEHISFANFDLAQNGYMEIVETEDKLYLMVHQLSDVSRVSSIVARHGFEVVSDPS